MAYIIGIGGMRATAKSTIARSLGVLLRADIESAGRIREIIRVQYKRDEAPELFESVTNTDSLETAAHYLYRQAEIIKPYLQGVIKQCRERESSFIIEGAHIYPGLYGEDLDLEVLLIAPEEIVKRRMHKDKIRRISETTLQRNIELQNHLKKEAEKYKVPIIDSTHIPRASIEIVGLLLKLPPDKLPKTYFE